MRSLLLQLRPARQLTAVFLVLLFACPWFIAFLSGAYSLNFSLPRSVSLTRVVANFAFYTSADYLFFQESGIFLPGFLPLVLIGFYHALINRPPRLRLLPPLVLAGLSLAAVFSPAPGPSAALWYLPQLTFIAAVGANILINLLRLPSHTIFKTLVWFVLIWFAYETLRFYQILLVHQPFAI